MKKIIVLFGLLALCSCSTVDVKTSPEKLPEITPPPIVSMNMKHVSINTSIINKKPYYIIDPMNFENLDNNIIEMRRYIYSQEAQIDFYKNLSESMEKSPKVKK